MDVPAATPVVIPVEEPIVAMLVLLLAHVPPLVVFARVVVVVAHTVGVPVIAGKVGLTVTLVVA